MGLVSPLPYNALGKDGLAKNFPDRVWGLLACFRSIQLAIVLLSLLAVSVMVGVMMPQDGLVDVYDIKRQFGSNYRILKAMGLFNVYSSAWFIALEVLFFFNLLIGSFKWLKPAYLAATQRIFLQPSHIQGMQNRMSAEPASLQSAEAVIRQWFAKRRYQVHTSPDNPKLLYAVKGNFSRLGPHLAHIGILLMLVSSVYGVFTGFKAQKMAAPGESFTLNQSNYFKTNAHESIWLGDTPNWRIKVNDFRVLYYPENPTTVQQYYADLSLLSDGGELLKRQTISVNHPLEYRDMTIYQASFNPTGKLLVEINGKPRILKADTQFEDRKVGTVDLGKGRMLIVFPFIVQQDPGADANKIVVFMKTPTGFLGAQTLAGGKPKMPENLRLREGNAGQIGGVSVKFLRPEFSTGLQIKKSPEVPWMYLSYVIIGIGAIMCIFSQRQIWVALAESKDGAAAKVWVSFKTNKARLSFLKELQRLQQALIKTEVKS